MSKQFLRSGFTIIELLVVIVVIGILTTLAIVSYAGISQKAVGVSLQSDLKNASTQLRLYQVENGTYPTSNDCTTGVAPTPPKICLRSSTGNSFGSSYAANNSVSPQAFTLTATNGTIAYAVTDSLTPFSVVAFVACPTGFVVVPGSGTYGTSDFCVMKYEAKMASATVPVSQSAGLPWVSISQTDAATYSQNVVGCTGCHLITEAQWLTIAQNVLNVPSNWISGVVGSGSVYRGNSDSSSGDVIAADSNDANGYTGTGNVSPSNQRRTLTLSNGEVIWDMGGNATEWTDGTAVNSQPGLTGESTFSTKDWNVLTVSGTLSPNPSPSATGIAGASTWSSANGIGALYSNSGTVGLRSFLHGGNWNNGGAAGILGLSLNYAAGSSSTGISFRAAR